MKQRFLLFAFLVLNVGASASARVSGGLVVKNHSRETFSVLLDRQRVATGVNAFQFTGLTPGRHYVKVYYDCFETNFRLHNDVLYDAWVDFRPGETLTLDIQRNGLVYASTFLAPCVETNAPRPISVCNKPVQRSHDTYVPAPVYYGMAPDDFFSLKQAVINRSFDSTKRELLASALKNNQVTSAQLYELLSLLDFDSSKVEIAKIGYGSVLDKQNFFKVYDAFSFDSSISELQRFIG